MGSSEEELVVGAASAGQRLDKLLAGLASVGSREKARQALKSGKVSVDGEAMGLPDAGRVLPEGARVEIAWARAGTGRKRTAGREAMARAGVVVRYEDDAILAVDKPVGLLTDAADLDQARNQDTLKKRVRGYLGGAMAWPVHRIDRNTTGLVLFAKTEGARDVLKEQWHARTPLREYVAVAEGVFRDDQGHCADWMAWDPGRKIQRPSREGAEDAWLGEADWWVIERLRGATVLGFRLVSGRRNQIRLHAQLMGHPLVGDVLYRLPHVPVRFERQALHARKLGVVHPTTGAPMTFTSPLAPDLEKLIRTLRADGGRRTADG